MHDRLERAQFRIRYYSRCRYQTSRSGAHLAYYAYPNNSTKTTLRSRQLWRISPLSFCACSVSLCIFCDGMTIEVSLFRVLKPFPDPYAKLPMNPRLSTYIARSIVVTMKWRHGLLSIHILAASMLKETISLGEVDFRATSALRDRAFETREVSKPSST